MKKIIASILVLVLCLGTLAGCVTPSAPSTSAPAETTTNPPETSAASTTEPAPAVDENLSDAAAYVKQLYKDAGEKIGQDITRVSSVVIGDATYAVVWTSDSDLVTITAGDNNLTTIHPTGDNKKDEQIVLTATLTGTDGRTESVSFNHLVLAALGTDAASILDAAYALADGETLPVEVTLTGKVISVDTAWSDEYGNITVTIEMEGEKDRPIQCYRLKGDGAKDLAYGDTITVTGNIKNYKGLIEFDAGCVVTEVTKGTGEGPVSPVDYATIVEEAFNLKPGQSLPYTATLTGRIDEINYSYSAKYGDASITIALCGHQIYCYRVTGPDTWLKQMDPGDWVTVMGKIKNYNGTVEFDNPKMIAYTDWNKVEGPEDIKEHIAAAEKLADDGKTSLAYSTTVTGTITKIKDKWSSQYKNISVYVAVDELDGAELLCYRLSSGEADASGLKVGDVVTVTGKLCNYKGTVQLGQGCMLDAVTPGAGTTEPDAPAVPDPTPDTALTIAEAITLGAGKEHNTYTEGKYYVVGEITEIYQTTYGNMKIKDAEGNILTVYGTYDADGTNRFDAMTTKPAVGDTIKVYGIIGQYNGTAQMKNGWITEITKGEAPSEPDVPSTPVPEVNENSPLADILLAAEALEEGETLGFKYTITGTIKESYGYSDQYKNITVIMNVADTTVQAYRLTGEGADTIKEGDTITVTGVIGKNSSGYLRFEQGCTLDKVVVGGGTTTDPDDTTDPSTEPTSKPTEGDSSVTVTPVSGKFYLQGKNKNGEMWFNGKVTSNNIMTTATKSEAVEVMLEKIDGTTNEYYMYYMDGQTKTYLCVNSGTADKSYAYGTATTPDEYCIWIIGEQEVTGNEGTITADVIVNKQTPTKYVASQLDGTNTRFRNYSTKNLDNDYAANYYAAVLVSVSGTDTDAPPPHTHSYTEEITKAATCGAKGEKKLTCSCGDTKTEEIAATGAHDYAAATCTAPKTCKVCGATTGEALGHTWTDATCTAPKTCSKCGATTGDALGHSYGEWTVTVTPSATNPNGEKERTCSVCQNVEKAVAACATHTWTDATCTEPKTCSTCKLTEGEKLGHAYSAATCTEAQKCSRCQTIGDPALGHDLADATCTAPKTCKRDGCDHTEGAALGHDLADATCTAPKTCKRPGCTYTEGEALGHEWSGPNCQIPKTCGVCGETEGNVGPHSWNDATCLAPKICELCGATEGEKGDHYWQAATQAAPKTCVVCGATEGDALTEAQVVDAAFALEAGESLPYSATLTGVVKEIKYSYSANSKTITLIMNVKDSNEATQELLCYYMKDKDGQNLAKTVYVGETIKVSGKIKNYQDTVEFDSGCILEEITVPATFTKPVGETAILAAAQALNNNEHMKEGPYTLKGTVTSVDTPLASGKMTVTIDVNGTTMQCYNLTQNETSLALDTVNVNDIITVEGDLTKFQTEVQFAAGCVMTEIEEKDAPAATMLEGTWKKVTDVAELTNGKKVIITATTTAGKSFVMGAQNSGGYRDSKDFVIESGIVTDNGVQILTLTVNDNGIAFETEDGKYLYWSSGNKLYTSNNISALDNTHYFTVTISGGITTVASKNDNKGARKLKYNSSNPRFACYTTDQTNIDIYIQESAG